MVYNLKSMKLSDIRNFQSNSSHPQLSKCSPNPTLYPSPNIGVQKSTTNQMGNYNQNRIFDLSLQKSTSTSSPEMLGYNSFDNYSPINPITDQGQQTSQMPMSSTFLQMKQQQERQSLLDSTKANPVSLESLKQQQAQERQQSLQSQNVYGSALTGFDLNQNAELASISLPQPLNTFTTFNAQGQVVSSQSLNHNQPNKYTAYKTMSPETLNQMYKRPAGQSVLPPTQPVSSGDIYEQTSYNYNQDALNYGYQPSHGQLHQQIKQSQQTILSEKSKIGIQSYTNLNFGSNLNDAYKNPN